MLTLIAELPKEKEGEFSLRLGEEEKPKVSFIADAANGKGDLQIMAANKATLMVGKVTVTIDVNGTVTIDAKGGEMNVEAKNINFKAPDGAINLESAAIILKGATTVTGSLDVK